MHIRPDFLSRTRGPDPAGTLEANADYSAYSDDWLLSERDRKQRQLDELTRHPDRSAVCSLLVSLDGEIERITDELIRRARSRHPSSRGPIG